MTISRFMYVMDISWQGALWGIITAFLFVGFYTFMVIISTWIRARQTFIKNELPQLHDNTIGLLQAENKKLKFENKKLEKEKTDHYDKLCVVRNLLKSEIDKIEKEPNDYIKRLRIIRDSSALEIEQ